MTGRMCRPAYLLSVFGLGRRDLKVQLKVAPWEKDRLRCP